jgi:uncharacterized membrane protein
LSDGVVAIIITLLVLEIHVPDLHNGQSFVDALGNIRPSLVAFLISFIVVAIAWAGHRDLFSVIRRTDRALVWLNFVYLLPLCLVPFGAALIARYPSETVALRLRGFLLVIIALTRIAIWVYATGNGHLLYGRRDPQFPRAGVTVILAPTVANMSSRSRSRACGPQRASSFTGSFPSPIFSASHLPDPAPHQDQRRRTSPEYSNA